MKHWSVTEIGYNIIYRSICTACFLSLRLAQFPSTSRYAPPTAAHKIMPAETDATALGRAARQLPDTEFPCERGMGDFSPLALCGHDFDGALGALFYAPRKCEAFRGQDDFSAREPQIGVPSLITILANALRREFTAPAMIFASVSWPAPKWRARICLDITMPYGAKRAASAPAFGVMMTAAIARHALQAVQKYWLLLLIQL